MAWSDFLSDIDWGSVLKSAVPAVAGTVLTSQANSKAARTIGHANQQAMGQLAAGNQMAQQRYQQVMDRTQPAVSYLQSVMADTGLTPAQQQRVQDTRRQTGQMLSSRLGGRSATAIATRAAQDLERGIYDTNRARSDQAAGTLAGQNLAAINASAGQDVNFGRDTAGLITNAGNTQAQAGLSTAQAQGKMIGDIMSPQADTMSALRSVIAEDRKGSYGSDWKSGAQ